MIYPISKHDPFHSLLKYWEDELPTVWTGTIDGFAAWTNGHFAVVGDLPSECESKPIDFSKMLNDIPSELKELTPVAFERHSSEVTVVLFSDGESVLNLRFYEAAKLRWPDARFFCSDPPDKRGYHCPIVVMSNGQRVAIIQRMRHELTAQERDQLRSGVIT